MVHLLSNVLGRHAAVSRQHTRTCGGVQQLRQQQHGSTLHKCASRPPCLGPWSAREACAVTVSPEVAVPAAMQQPMHGGNTSGSSAAAVGQQPVGEPPNWQPDQNRAGGHSSEPLRSEGGSTPAYACQAGNNIIPMRPFSNGTDNSNGRSAATAQLQEQPMLAGGMQPSAERQPRVWLPDKQLWIPPSSNGASPAPREGSAAGSSAQLQRVYMAAAATRGRKRCMEDRHVLAALDPASGVQQAHGPVGLQKQVSVAAVFDGHAGYATAAYAAQHIPHLLHEALSGTPGRADGGPRVPQKELLCPRSALAASFHWFDRWWADARCDPSLTEHGWDDSGSTAVVGLVSGKQLIVANAGDSIALLAHGGASRRLTVEHRLDNQQEAERVLGAGGRVVSFKPGAAPRVMGSSNQTRFKGSMVTRSLGDFAFKHPQALISADPHVEQAELTPSDKLVVLASDGVTDVLPDDDMLEAALRAIEQTQQATNSGQALAKAAALAIMSGALEAGSTDNITVVTMLLDWGCEYSAD